MQIDCSIEILADPDQVFPWIDDPEKAMLWQQGVKGGEIIKETPERIGTSFVETMEEGGSSIEMRGVITGYTKNKLIAFHLESKIHVVDVTYSVAGADGRSLVLMESKIRWKFPMNIMRIFLGRKIKNGILEQTESEFAELKWLCEAENSFGE
jgi:hypothetical protein